ncbi:MAG: response regulator [Candidatus Tectimicrobiota bacterium]
MSEYDSPAYRDASMLALFQTEVETQVGLMNEALLALERDPLASAALTVLMRAAHSIKGAARVVDLSLAEQLAHVLEDCFVAAQAGRVGLGSEQIEVLLQGVDLLLHLAQHAASLPQAHLAPPEATGILRALTALAAAAPPTLPAAPQPGSAVAARPVAADGRALQETSPPAQEPRGSGRAVRVTMEHLNRLLGLAGESLVEARWLQPFATSLLHLKSQHMALATGLETLRESLQACVLPARAAEHLQTARRQAEVCRQLLADRLSDLDRFMQRSESLADRLYQTAIASHMRPFEDGVQGLPRMVRDLARQLSKQVTLEITGRTTEVDRDILERLEAPLEHLLRNALDHGIETPAERLAVGKAAEGSIRLEARHHAGMLAITVSDDGRGVEIEALRQTIVAKGLLTPEVAAQLSSAEVLEFLFLPAFSTAPAVTEISGRGVGLDVVRSMTHAVGGTVRAVSTPGQGMTFHLQLPLTLSVLRALLVEIAGEPYALPLARLDHVLCIAATEVSAEQTWPSICVAEQSVALVSARQVLEIDAVAPSAEPLAVVLLSAQSSRCGLIVDRFLGEADLVVQPLDPRLGKVPDISAAALLEDGSPVLILDVEDVVRSAAHLLAGRLARQPSAPGPVPTTSGGKRVLVVEDSLTVREAERRLLTQHGYEVDVAVDGMDGWNAVRAGQYDLVISDVDMPRLDGCELARRIKQEPALHHLPVLLVSYKGREEDRRRGLAAGAQAYITKSDVQQTTFLQTVMALLAAARPGEG